MAVTRMRFKQDNNGTYYIDLAKSLSLQERKLHRQKMIYTVYGGYFVDSQGSRIDLNTAPITWVTKRAVNRGFQMWRTMTARTLQDAGTNVKSKYRDFKVYLNQASGSNYIDPVDAGGKALYASMEWDYATMTSDDPDGPGGTPPDQFELKIVGPHGGSNPDFTRVSLIKSWRESRPFPEPTQPDDIPNTADPLMNLFDAGDAMDDRLNVINVEQDSTPYDPNMVFGENGSGSTNSDNLQRMSTAQPTGGNQPVAPIHGFDAICGLIQVVVGSGTTANSWELVLDVESKGVKF